MNLSRKPADLIWFRSADYSYRNEKLSRMQVSFEKMQQVHVRSLYNGKLCFHLRKVRPQ